jgi:pyridoxal 5'-phosphate synthase pdxT subunit
MMKKKVGVLAVQGAFYEHICALQKLGVQSFEIRQKSDLTNNHLDGLILPGGESTVMGKLIKDLTLFDDIKFLISDGLPVFGTCAGLILLAKTITNDDNKYFETMDISVKRNAYGRQLGSFKTLGNFGAIKDVPMTFIRAPLITSVSNNVDVLAVVENDITAAKQGNMLVTSFHPELSSDLRIHEYFLGMM